MGLRDHFETKSTRTREMPSDFTAAATGHLRRMLGPDATFREGQLEAIHAIVANRDRVLVVQKTGWGKSLVYFIATRMMRDRGSGPTFLVSPLLSLMRNQEEMAARIGITAQRLTSDNRQQWSKVISALRSGQCDLLMVSPERLANSAFRRDVLPTIEDGIGMLVVDEAHCISDWGHDFRPDYRRIIQIVNRMPSTIPVLATTATANDRVIADIENQLGQTLQVLRGPLARGSLQLQAIPLGGKAERLAWMAEHLPSIAGTGIIYCLTVRDTELVARWLQLKGTDVHAYNASLQSEERIELEQRLLRNEVKGLAATVALGMGFDKPDLSWVIHYQPPGSIVAYYQQVGRAGRAVEDALAILLSGHEDDEILEYFITSAFPEAADLNDVATTLALTDGLRRSEIEQRVNLKPKRIEQCLKVLEVEGAVLNEDGLWQRTARGWKPDIERARLVTQLRYREREEMQAFVETKRCYMQVVTEALDDPSAAPCGRCANCLEELLSPVPRPDLIANAQAFLGRSWTPIEPRRMLAPGVLPDKPRKIPQELQLEPGIALCAYTDTGHGTLVKQGKYGTGSFDDQLVVASREAITATWPIDTTWWLTSIPSLRHPELVESFARRLAHLLNIPYEAVLIKTGETGEQKLMQNSSQQLQNILHAFRCECANLRKGSVILVDDMVDSRWTFTMCGAHLRRAGSGPVYPFALASIKGP